MRNMDSVLALSYMAVTAFLVRRGRCANLIPAAKTPPRQMA